MIDFLEEQWDFCPRTFFYIFKRFESIFDFSDDDLRKLIGYEMQLISWKNYTRNNIGLKYPKLLGCCYCQDF